MGAPRQGANTQFERTIEQAERDAEMARYKPGRTYAQVAEHFGMSTSAAHKAVQRAINTVPVAAGREIIAEELLKLDALEQIAHDVLRANHYVVSDGRIVRLDDIPLKDCKPVLMAIDRLIKVSESRRRLLGLDAPTKQTVTVITEDIVDAEIRRLEHEMEALNASTRQA